MKSLTPNRTAADLSGLTALAVVPARGMVYTLFRHGRGLSSKEAAQKLREALRPDPGGPGLAA